MPDSESQTSAQPINPEVLALLRCPVTRSPLSQDGDWLVAEQPTDAGLRYPIKDGIPVLLMDQATLPKGVRSLEAFKAKYANDIAD